MILAMSEALRDFGVVSAVVLGLAGLGIGSAAFIRIGVMQGHMDEVVDKATPSFAEEHQERRADVVEAVREFADADTDPKIPIIGTARRPTERTDTVENDMPAKLAQATMEAEQTVAETAWREFVKPDGTTVRFQVRGKP